jgi:hypothetical protein
LQEWDVYANPLTFPPAEILQAGMHPTLQYLRDYEAMLLRQTIAGMAAGVGGFTALLLAGLKLRQRRMYGKKKKKNSA